MVAAQSGYNLKLQGDMVLVRFASLADTPSKPGYLQELVEFVS